MMCWKSPLSADFAFKAGILVVIGPLGGQTFSCFKEAACRLEGVQGIGLAHGDSAMVLPFCGCPERVRGMPHPVQMASADVVEWPAHLFQGEPLVNAAAYEVCWCYRERACSGSSDFVTSIGQLLVRDNPANYLQAVEAASYKTYQDRPSRAGRLAQLNSFALLLLALSQADDMG
eukprot:gnl/TRDRNA2_/TRDRNA2_166966_c2_seq2.p1 gnl/TRDRNA2_/TRDRNA2_166966_c2~~gnl/TRDRNA2_/TRDRNA2_166966_c2_seq2.p1  ORF type:complete len:175 (-),score=23.38 gnl/TRDRNA2_/TRDRNA2_166966_c2_seq2:112-636(-)